MATSVSPMLRSAVSKNVSDGLWLGSTVQNRKNEECGNLCGLSDWSKFLLGA